MSVLSLPRLHFYGDTRWNPSTANNSQKTYSVDKVQPLMDPPFSLDTYREYIMARNPDMLQPNGSWNIFGDHAAEFNAKTHSAQLAGGFAKVEDPALGLPVWLDADGWRDPPQPPRLVMTDPYTAGAATSMIFYRTLYVGSDGSTDPEIGIKATFARPAYSRWPSGARGLMAPFKENNWGCVWHGAADKNGKDSDGNPAIQFFGMEKSDTLKALAEAVQRGKGLVFRFASYSTRYYVEGVHKGKPITNGVELVQAYQDGWTGYNSAFSNMMGSIGVWEPGEMETECSGRLLFPGVGQLTGTDANARLGMATAKVDEPRKVVAMAWIAAIPERDSALRKADFGTLTLRAVGADPSDITEIGDIEVPDYGLEAYSAAGGIVEVPIPDTPALDKIKSGRLEVVQRVAGEAIPVLSQTRFQVATDDWAVWLDQDEPKNIVVRVMENGGPPTSKVALLLVQYNSDGLLRNGEKDREQYIDVRCGNASTDVVDASTGSVTLTLRSIRATSGFLVFIPFVGDRPKPPEKGIPDQTTFYAAVRALPFENYLERVPDEKLNWKYVYSEVLQLFDLVYPIMSMKKPLNTPESLEQMKNQIVAAFSESSFESARYMPITRDLSKGRKDLLLRFLKLLPNLVPDAPSEPKP